MRATSALFTISFVTAAAAGWHYLEAAQDADGPDQKPPLTRLTLEGHAIEVGVDHDRVEAGGSVALTVRSLDGFAGEVRIVVQEQSSQMDSRMEPPAKTLSSKLVAFGATEPAKVPIELLGTFHDDDADPLATAGAATRYTILVVSDYDKTASAALPVFAYEPEAYRLTVDEPTAAGPGEPSDVTVHVKSKAKKDLQGITISLSSTFVSSAEYPVIDKLEPGDEVTVTLHGTRLDVPADAQKVVQAFGSATYGGTATAMRTVH